MPAKDITINLLGNQDLEHTPWGRIVLWATTYGRYIMITTEIIVLLAFISRFSLDRKLTDLNEEITQKFTIIEANKLFEKQIKSLQANANSARTIMDKQSLPITVTTLLESLLPVDVYVELLQISPASFSTDVVAGSIEGFAQFIKNIETTKMLKNATIGDVSRNAVTGIRFHVSAEVAAAPKQE